MTVTRRHLMQAAVGGVALSTISRVAIAETYPSRPVRWIVGQAASSSSDIAARVLGQWLSEHLGQQFVIDDRPGAGGNIGTEAVAHSIPDGYTLLLVNSQNAINATLYTHLNYDFIRDIAPVAGIYRVPLVMEVTPSFPAKTIPEFIAYAKANPRKINMASPGVGSPQHLSGELFKYLAGVDLVHVPYRGTAPAMTDLLAGQVQVTFDVAPSSVPHIKAGRLRALGVTTANHVDVLPDVPTIAEFLPNYEASAWVGVGAPRNTPPAVVETLNKGVNSAIGDDKVKTQLMQLGAIMLPPGPPSDFGELVARDTEKWRKVISFAGVQPS
jgi:tripartite-type tricarboxylate transporter receptor subunit TctC